MKRIISKIFNDDVVTVEQLEKILKGNDEKLLKLVTEGFSDVIQRAECYNFNIQHIEDGGDGQFTVSYCFDYNVYNGCADMDVEGEWEDSVLVTVENGQIILEVPELPSYKNRQFD